MFSPTPAILIKPCVEKIGRFDVCDFSPETVSKILDSDQISTSDFEFPIENLLQKMTLSEANDLKLNQCNYRVFYVTNLQLKDEKLAAACNTGLTFFGQFFCGHVLVGKYEKRNPGKYVDLNQKDFVFFTLNAISFKKKLRHKLL